MSVQFDPSSRSASIEANQATVETRPPASLGTGDGTSTLQSMVPVEDSGCCLWTMLSSLWNWLKGLFCCSAAEIKSTIQEPQQAEELEAATEIDQNIPELFQENQPIQGFAEIEQKINERRASLRQEINERRANLRQVPEIVENKWWKRMEIDCTSSFKTNEFPLRLDLPPHDFEEKYYAEFFYFLSPYINSPDKKEVIKRFMLIRGQYDMKDRVIRISQGIIGPNTQDSLLREENPFIYGKDVHSFVCDFLARTMMMAYSAPSISEKREVRPTFLSQINPLSQK